MSYKIESLRVKNFKCFDNSKFYEFNFNYNLNPVVLSGPNGFGKTTFFDAIELIFTKKITRFTSSIEGARTNLGKNILLNTADDFGYLILTLINKEKQVVTLVVKIENTTKIDISSTLKFAYLDNRVATEDIHLAIDNIDEWKASLEDLAILSYIREHFNIYYYISQAESVHFLKRSINDRKNSLSEMLQLDLIESNISQIIEKIIGKSKTSKNVLVNKESQEIEEMIASKVQEIKNKTSLLGETLTRTTYKPLLIYKDDISPKVWDLATINFQNKKQEDIDEYYNEIDALASLSRNFNDFQIYRKNLKIKQLSNNSNAIKNYIKYYLFIKNRELDKESLEAELDKINTRIEVFSRSKFIRESYNISDYQKEHLEELNTLLENKLSIDVNKINSIVESIIDLEQKISIGQKKIEELNVARTALYKLSSATTGEVNCPYCNYEYSSPTLLEEAYQALSSALQGGQSEQISKIKDLKEDLQNSLASTKENLLGILGSLSVDDVKEIHTKSLSIKEFLASEKAISEVLEINKYILESRSWLTLTGYEQEMEIKKTLTNNFSGYNNPSFEEALEKFSFMQLYEKNKELVIGSQIQLNDEALVLSKKNYIQYNYVFSKNEEIIKLKAEAKELLQKKYKLKEIYDRFCELRKFYEDIVKGYKNDVLKKLRVPLLIYTGKILQDYQNGLGVFIDRDDMRFVSNGDAKHDILNTFSSGQLSAFVLSFLFSMNKRYISSSSDDIGFILIDDPVQTMDDINISSLVEVLRNDFKDKQVILSTHEHDKENYILYKFLKYNIKGQSFNVKNKMYS